MTVTRFMVALLLLAGTAMGALASTGDLDPKAPFTLRVTTTKQAQAVCPRPLVPMYEKLHADQYFACDDGKNTTVLVFSNDKLIAIMDLKFFAKWEAQ